MAEPLFTRDGDLFVPSEHTASPWRADAQHGGAAAALLGRALEALPADSPMRVARCTVDILGPVPLAPLRVVAAVDRPGRRVQLARASLLDAGGTERCRATAWRIRVGADTEEQAARMLPFRGPLESDAHTPESDAPAFHRTGVELRFARGSFFARGPSTVWIRLRRAVVDGESPSPLQRALAASDFGNGVSAVLDWSTHLFINTDLTVALHREPAGEWVCLDAVTCIGPGGVALAESALYDTGGGIGRAMQTLLVERMQREVQ